MVSSGQARARTTSPTVPTFDPAALAILDFLGTAEKVIARLGARTAVRDWVVARYLDDEWVVLAGGVAQGLRPGDDLANIPGAADALGARRAAWDGDTVVDLTTGEPSRQQDDSPASAEEGSTLRAFPLWGDDELFGVVCALPASADQAAALEDAVAMVELSVELLTSVLVLDLDRNRLQRRLDAAESAALSDPLTDLGNRRAFDRAMDREEARCARFGHLAGVLVLDLDGLKALNDTLGHDAGDDLLRRAADTLRTTLRGADQAFRIGGDEFACLLPEVTAIRLDAVVGRLGAAFDAAGISVSVGSAIRRPNSDLRACARIADAAMYERKRSHRERRAAPAPQLPG